ncbi:DUF222 domain-containing protein [Nocardioides sp. YIM 152588]|uniref:HNH endonuclease signature motif containing protein n=1 Tax=Nocardioides sp. YIM 152588 TaxID=3158259 RepID=UPI0032E38DBF
MTLLPGPVPHRITRAVADARAALAGVADAQAAFLGAGEKEAVLTELVALEAQVAELRLRTMAAAGDVADAHGARDVAGWLAHRTNLEVARLRGEARVAGAIDQRWPNVGSAMAAGRLSLDQAKVVVQALDALPERVGAAVRGDAEARLVALGTGDAAECGGLGMLPQHLRVLGRRVLDVVAPEVAEDEEARRLHAEETHAQAALSVRIKPLGDGATRVTMTLPDATATRLATYLDALTSPRTTAPEVERLPRHRVLGHAFCTLLDRLDPSTLPDHGGDATTVMVTVPLDQLEKRLGAAGLLDSGTADGTGRISAAHARRLACTAKIVPAVLGGRSEVLDLGRGQRLFSAAQRKALRLRDTTCRAEGCTVPATWCDAHHDVPWSHGGGTDLANAVLLCGFHHHRAHDPAYETDRLPNGDHRYHRRR